MKSYLLLRVQFKYVIFIFLSMNLSIALSQERHTITGSISVAESEPVESVTVQMVNVLDTNFSISSEIEKGEFRFNLLQKGQYIIYIDDMRFERFSQNVNLEKDVHLDIQLIRKSIDLQEVVVQGGRNGLFNDGGNIKLNVHGSIYSSVSNSLDLLQKMP